MEVLSPWPDDRNTLPVSYVKPMLAEIRPGAVFYKYFALFRIQDSVATGVPGLTTVDILYGTGKVLEMMRLI
jgi:hypothetical protein